MSTEAVTFVNKNLYEQWLQIVNFIKSTFINGKYLCEKMVVNFEFYNVTFINGKMNIYVKKCWKL